jgi:hypothetical protein
MPKEIRPWETLNRDEYAELISPIMVDLNV